MSLRLPASDSFAGIPAPEMAAFLRQVRTWQIERSRQAQAWRFSLSDLRTEEQMEMLTAGEAMGLIAPGDGPGVYQITPKGQAVARAEFAPTTASDREGTSWIASDQGSYLLPVPAARAPVAAEAEREVLELFAALKINRHEVEDRIGLTFGEALVRMAELGIKRQRPEKYEGMSEAQKALFDEIFSPPKHEYPAPDDPAP